MDSPPHKYEDRYIFEFKRDYYRHGKHDLGVQVHHLGRLADYYVNRYNNLQPQHWTDCLKAHALCNSAAARKPCSEGWPQRAFDIQRAYWGEWSDITYDQQSKITQKLLDRLYGIRDNIRLDLTSADKKAEDFPIHQSYPADMMSDFSVCMQEITVGCTDEMVKFSGLLIEESVKVLNRAPPCDFSVIGLGSLARGETTPFSDLEYLFLVDSKSVEIEEYFERLAITSYFLIGNLKETNLKYMHIAELKGWFEDRCKSGFKIDGLSPGAGNIPTGNGQDDQRNHFIVTPDELSSRYREVLNNPEEEKALRGDLTSMLSYMKTIYVHGDEGRKLVHAVSTDIYKLVNSGERMTVNMEMLKSDVTKFNFSPDKKIRMKGFTVDVKREIYRFPSILLLDISIVSDCVSDSSWATCDKLQSDGHMTIEFHRSLKFMLACACYMRLSAYLHLDSDCFNDGISVAPVLSLSREQTNPSPSYRKWFMPVGLYTVLCQTLMKVREGVAAVLKTSGALCLEKLDISKEENLWISNLQSLYSAGRFMDCLHVLQTEISNDASVLEYLQKFYENHPFMALNESQLLEIIADVYDQCSKPRHALKITQYLNTIIDCDRNKLSMARLHISLCEYDKALEIISSVKERTADCLLLLGRIYEEQGHLQKAERTLVEALQLYCNEASQPPLYDYYGCLVPNDETIAEEFPDLLNCYPEIRPNMIQAASSDIIKCVSYLGNIYWKMGNLNLQKAYDKKTSDLIKVVYGDEALVESLGNLYTALAVTYDCMNDYEQSEQHYLRALEICENLYGRDNDHLNTAIILSNLGVLCYNQGDYSKAEDYHRRALSIRLNVYGEKSTHDDIIRVMRNQSNNYRALCRFSEAQEILYQTLARLRERHGADTDHSDVAESLGRIGTFHTDIKQYSTADDYLHQALDMYQRIHGPDSNHKDISLVLFHIGCNHDENSDPDKAVEFYNRASVMIGEVSNEDSRYDALAGCLHTFSQMNEAQKQVGESAEYLQQTLAMRRELYSERPDIDLTNNTEMYSKCLENYQNALLMYRVIYSTDSNQTVIASILREMGLTYKKMGEYSSAEEYYTQSLEMYRAIYGADSNHVDIAQTLCGLGGVNSIMGHYDKCLEFYNQSLSMYREVQETEINEKEVAGLLLTLGAAHFKHGEFGTAEDYFYQSQEMSRGICGADSNHLDIADCLRNLASSYSQAGNQ